MNATLIKTLEASVKDLDPREPAFVAAMQALALARIAESMQQLALSAKKAGNQ